MNHKTDAFARIITIMDELREKCPWDRKQTMETLRPLTVEETCELSDAILKSDTKSIKEELGDLLLHIVFYSKIAEEKKQFDIADVIHNLSEKLIARHPHIYGDVKVADDEEVKKNWEMLKLKEGKRTVLGGVPSGLPSLIKAYRIQDKAAQVKFEWTDIKDVWQKVVEEQNELTEAVKSGSHEKTEEEFGDLLFALVNYSRFLKLDAEAALEKTNQKFIRRFNYIEQKAEDAGKPLRDMSLDEMDQLWNEAKRQGL